MSEGKIKDLGKLFVGGLSHLTTEKELDAYFSKFGKVIDSVVRRLPNCGKSLKFGFVTFCNPEDAKAALKVGDHMINGKLIELRPFSSKPPSEKFETRVFLEGLPHDITEEKLREFFSRYGKVLRVVIPRDITNQIKGHGYLVFSNNQAVEKCLADKFVFISRRRVRIERARDNRQRENDSSSSGSVSDFSETSDENDDKAEVSCGKSIKTRSISSELLSEALECRVFLGGLPYDVTEKTLRQIFSKYGELVEVIIPRDKNTNQNKGFGFLVFSDRHAVEKCEADQFVFLEGRRIQIKKAKPRRHCKFSDNLSSKSDSETSIYEALEDGDEDDEEAQSDVSGDKHPDIEQNSEFKAVIKNYLLEKLANFDAMNEKKSKNENETKCSQLSEIEKLLADFLSISDNSNPSASTSDLMKFSSESEEETESDDDAGDSFPPDLSKAPILNSKGNSSDQKPLPLQIRNSEGFLMCSVCQWVSPNDSMETFLAHCKTSLHKIKLKDRFPSGQTDNQLPQKIDSKPKPVAEKPPATSGAKAKKRKKTVNNKKKINEQQRSEEVASNKQNKEETNAGNKVKNEKQNPRVDANLKIYALAKGMASIQPFTKDELMCKLCNKKIPKALELDVLMKNVSTHLHSKMHLKKLSETESSFKGSRASTPTLNCKGNENQKQNHPNAQEKKEKKCQEGIRKNKAPDFGKCQNESKASNNPPKKKPAEKKQEKDPYPDPRFLCLPCNVWCDSIEVFNVHVKLKSHADNLANKNVKADVSMANMARCKGCKLYLCGSLYQINKHYSKCVDNN